jgi:hypothetical protein
VGKDEDAKLIEHFFGEMKRLPPTPHAGQSSHTYGTSGVLSQSYPATTPRYPAGSSYQVGSSYQTPSGFIGQPTDEIFDDSEDDGNDQMEVDEETDHAAVMNAGSNYHVVKVSKKARNFKKDEFVFKDKKGKSRSTVRDDWKEITYNGQSAWKHHKYVCLEDIF